MLDGRIIRGTTPMHTFSLPKEMYADSVSNLTITYCVKNIQYIQKELWECEISGNSIQTKLTEADTLSLPTEGIVKVQLKIQYGDEVLVSSKYYLRIEDSLDGEAFSEREVEL